jgi:hypothetical protein
VTIRIVHNKLLGGWFVVRGKHQTPIGGRFETKADAQAYLARGSSRTRARISTDQWADNVLKTFGGDQ